MKKEFLGRTKNGKEVYFDSETSHAVTHFASHPHLREHVEKMIPKLTAEGELVRIECDTGEEAGLSDLVETEEGDEIVYALRLHRTVYSRFVKHTKAIPTQWITLDLRQVNDEEYILYTAFVGRLTPSFPGGEYRSDESIEFWSKHALVWGNQQIVPGTETTQCPW